MDVGLGPSEGGGVVVIGLDEGIDVLLELLDRGEGGAAQGLAFQDREPDLDLVEPGGAGRREVEVHLGMTLEPAVALGLMGAEIIENDVEVLAWVGGDDAVHEVEELDAPATLFVGGDHLASGHLEGGEQGGGAVAYVIVAAAAQRPAIRQ